VLATPGSGSRILWGSYNGALIRSKDLGVTWTPIYITEPGLPQPPVLQFDIDVVDPNIVYLSTTLVAGGIWKSTDGGTTWVKANAGLPTSGGVIEYFKQIPATPPFFYVKTGPTIYKSTDRSNTWQVQGTLTGTGPGTSQNLDVNEQTWTRMYYIDESTLKVWTSFDEGRVWQTFGNLTAVLQPPKILGTASLYTNPTTFYSSIDGIGQGQGSYVSNDNGKTNLDATATGLGFFTKLKSSNTGPAYAFGVSGGSYRSVDNGQTWKNVGVVGLEKYDLTAIDPIDRTILYGIKTSVGKTLIRSIDAGDSWTPISSTITPTLAKPAAVYNVVLQEGAPYSVAFVVQASEDPSWKLSATLSTSGEPWLSVATTSGTTPTPTSFTIDSKGLAPGQYTATLKIDAAQSSNKSVSVPINLTIVPLGSIGPGYQVNSIVGSGSATTTGTSGPATTIGIGAARAMTFDSLGNLVISAGNRIWSLTGTNLTLLAGNGVNDSSGDGLDPTQASVSDPEAIAVGPAGDLFFTEYAPQGIQANARVRKLSGQNISTPLQFSRFGTLFPNGVIGSHSLVLDSSSNFLVTGPTGLLRYDLAKLLLIASYPFVDPYSMAVGADGNYYISDRGAHQIFKMTPTGQVSVFAGTGIAGFGGDGGSALVAGFNKPSGLVFDAAGTTLYVADTGNQRVRQIGPDGSVRTIAGSGVVGFAGDSQTGDFASFHDPVGLAIDTVGNLYVADSGNNRVRKLVLRVVPTPKPSALVRHLSKSSQLAPGALFDLYGDSLAAAVQTNAVVPWPRSLQGVSVTINGVTAPLYYISPGQINGQIPYETPTGSATAVVTVNGSSPAQISFSVVPASPNVVVVDASFHAAALNQDNSINTSTNPAKPADFVQIYLSGIGQSTPPVATGDGAPSVAPFAMVKYSQSITLGGQPCNVVFFGLAPGFPALAQANFAVPNLPPGEYPLVVTVNGVASDPVSTLSVGSK
jgi:uncharacterized protein (TIGR03437 family)